MHATVSKHEVRVTSAKTRLGITAVLATSAETLAQLLSSIPIAFLKFTASHVDEWCHKNISSAMETNRRSHCVESTAAASYSVPYGEVPYSVKIENVKRYATTNACILRLGTFRLVFYVALSCCHGQQAHHSDHIVH